MIHKLWVVLIEDPLIIIIAVGNRIILEGRVMRRKESKAITIEALKILIITDQQRKMHIREITRLKIICKPLKGIQTSINSTVQ